jgi:tetratricopeptide (TPR) repeat protein
MIVAGCGLAAAAPEPVVDEGAHVRELIAGTRAAVQQLRGAQPAAPWEGSAAKAKLQALWQYGREHAMSPAGAQATATALQLLQSLGRADDVREKIDTLGAQEPAWPEVMWVLLQQAESAGDFSGFLVKAQWVVDHSENAMLRAQLLFTMGRIDRETGRRAEAEAAFNKCAEIAPSPELAVSARGAIYEMHNLNRGQDAPAFSVTSLSGEPVALAKLRGKVVILDFWGSA